MTEKLTQHQVAFYLVALLLGALASSRPALAHLASLTISPALALLLLATFLSIPLTGRNRPRAGRPLTAAVLTLNFLVAPLVLAGLLAGLTLLQPATPDLLLVTAALVLLAPCIDYVIVFTNIAGGNHRGLLALTPLLLVLQILLVPLWLAIFQALGFWQTGTLDWALLATSWPQALGALALIGLPLGAAAALQALGGRARVTAEATADTLMVPLMMAVLGATATAHASVLIDHWQELATLTGLYALYAILLWVLSSALTSRQPTLTPPDRIAATLSPITRNSLVVLPLILSLSTTHTHHSGASLMPLAVLAQTLTELILLTLITATYRHQPTQKGPAPNGTSPLHKQT